MSIHDLIGEVESVPNLVVDESLGPEVRSHRGAILETMHQIIQTELTEKQRSVLLAELQGMPQEELSQQLGTNRNAVYKLAHDARKKLKQGLEAAGYRAEDIHTTFSD